MHAFANATDKLTIETNIPLATAWQDKTVYQRLMRTANRVPDRPAVGFQIKSSPKDKAHTLTWWQFARAVTQTANALRALGVQRGDVVACILPNMPETLMTMMGAMTAGIIQPINPTLDAEQIAALINESGAKVVVTLKSFPKTNLAQLTAEVAARSPNVKTIIETDLMGYLTGVSRIIAPLLRPKNTIKHNAQVIDFAQITEKCNGDSLDFTEDEDDPFCAYFHTGGTTGMPKIAQHRHSGALYNGWCCGLILYKETDVILCPLPLFHVFAAYPIWMGCISTGAQIVLPTPAGYRGEGVFDNLWALIERWRVTVLFTVPTAVAATLQRDAAGVDVSSLELVICGSAPLPVALFKRFEAVTGVQIMEGYGMTEATCLVSCNPADGVRKVGSVGIPLPYTNIKIDGADAFGKVGEICVANPGVVVGATYTQPERNAGLFDGDFARTGDLGYLDSDGYLWITGRAKDVIIRGGHNIDPAVIEEALLSCEAVAFAGAIGQPDVRAGELPCVYVELTEGAEVSVDDLYNLCDEAIGERAARPKHIEVLEELPKTAVGKVFKPALRKLAITRVYDAALADAGLAGVFVSDVVEDKRLGLVAHIGGTFEHKQVEAVLGGFIGAWQTSDDEL